MRKIVVLLIVLILSNFSFCGNVPGTTITNAAGVSSAIAKESNCIIAYPDGPNLNTIYDQTDSWSLGANEWGSIVLMPGVYDLGSTKLLMDNTRVKLIGIPPVTITTTASSPTSDYLVEITAFQYGLENIDFIATTNCEEVHVNNCVTGTGSYFLPTGVVTLAASVDNLQVDDKMYVYTDGGTDGAWYTISAMSSTNPTISVGLGYSTCKYEIVSMHTMVRNCSFYGGSKTIPSFTFEGDIGGKWNNCDFWNHAFLSEDETGWDVVAELNCITAGTKFLGIDQGNQTFYGTIQNFSVGVEFMGCSAYGGAIGDGAVVANGKCGNSSVGLGRRIASGAMVMNVIGGNDCFAAPNPGGGTSIYTGGSATGATDTVSYSGSYQLQTSFLAPQIRGRHGFTVYLDSPSSDADMTAGYYEIESVDEENDTITFASNCTTGDVSDVRMYWAYGEIEGTVINCYATDADSFADQEAAAPSRVMTGGGVLNCYNGTSAIADITH